MPRRPRARGRIARGVASRARRARPPASSRAKSATAFADAFSRYASFPDRAQAQLRSKSTAALRATKPVVVAKAAFRVNAAASDDTLTKVRTIISEQLGTDLDAVAADAKFVDLGADSLDTVEIMMALEEQFEITLDEEGAEKIATVQEAADMIQDQMK
ncbi:uncharacterized protein MICPUCDRAFT_63269 [Micromonas pusilla CCMP1545]|uniref:Acyl carrier protein n=1 Tax=Micromonas pusilla (strain CCMP1545) TaxID=564608 RepID=C1MZ31_MICPC|nr:uncharacterized protein MICPUCDRAFT_63269 [Micromonas pusilla CCMP1545]EEH54794.1 predicted protein [Micromonas pusilla CCMP1545]|eukprot:XP_003061144.1 predicted protein [Micromonas pusilla CCMP1545]